MSEEEIQIVYLDKEITMKKTETYKEFISQLVYKLFLTEKMKKSLSLKYFDEDNEEIPVDESSYSCFLSEANKAFVEIPEPSNDLTGNYDNIKKEVEEKMKLIKDDINKYKIKLKESCKNTVKKKLKEVDDKNLKELKDLKESYENKLIKIKEENEKQIQNLLEDMQNKSEDIILEKLNEYNEYINKEIENIIKGKEQSLKEKVNEIDFGALEQKQSDVRKVVENNKKELSKAIND